MTRIAVRRLFGFGLLAAQLVASGAVSLAHARERYDAPRHIESTTSDLCLAVHDATRCVLCAWSHVRTEVPPQRVMAPASADVTNTWSLVVAEPHPAPAITQAQARAPPTLPG